MSSVPFQGIIAYPITPFTQDDQVDLTALKALLDKLLASGVHGISPLGSTGVLPYLSDEEREAVTETTLKHISGRVPILVGVSSLTTERTIYHAKFAEKAGATAVMVIPMSYWKLTDDEIVEHYKTVAEAISVPIMAYNNPATGGIDMSSQLLARLLEISNVVMIKESTGDVQRMYRLFETFGSDVAIYNGSNPLALAAFGAGARGWCTAAPCLIPELTLGLYEALSQNDLERGRVLFYQQFPLLEFIVQRGLPRTIAAGLELLGMPMGPLRAPLKPLEQKEVKFLKTLLQRCLKPQSVSIN
ncbi:MAG: dihydrodipicolinate synthase family protein [Cyanobacteriota/Melainabacteria group bacterium]